jgi:hypothetical protein
VGADELGDHRAELLARIFLQEMTRPGEHGMLDASSARLLSAPAPWSR